VKLGIRLATNQRVAIKIMNHRLDHPEPDRPSDDKVVELFLNEVKLASEARHPHVV
jgi:serine/threonine protein kinase